QPPRRTSRSLTRKLTESLSSCSTTRESENLPSKVIRWSVAIEPAMSREPLGWVTTRKTTHRYGWVYLSVAPTVEDMTPYEEMDSPTQLHSDCEKVNRRLARAARKVVEAPPSIHFEDFPREVPKQEIRISEAAQRLANAMHLHLD